uniref:Cnidarian restricted protein n=1 Tax=Clytia hemisphaerica TaxID=252671 RepID=A0A7M5XBX1_9CNID
MSRATILIQIAICACVAIAIVQSQQETAEVVHDISSQARCGLVYGLVSTDCRWESGLSFNADQEVLGGRIAAYKILWPKGWGMTWYVPGVNDLDKRYNVYGNSLCSYEKKDNSMRRKWAYFTRYPHMYILCKHREDNPNRRRQTRRS